MDFSGILRISPVVGIVLGKTFYMHGFTVPFMFGSISCEFIDFESLLINNKDFSSLRSWRYCVVVE